MNDSEKHPKQIFDIPEKGFGIGDTAKREDRVDVSPAGTEGCLWVDDFPELDGE
ncbi:hypothetical protein [Desulforhabdus amnigena]|jgi:hypothetical protein|uniref:Uncharacterized protein n=1 Tax=Desulforhabdus amnigena TaxID=40218 RepID=A0A9W6L950_9BACT|nr:hypothetical protein [Desulforhabdus amnigena]NLJ28561.1 hypothetical protein [Deltaproteobacteria bacterium]GLI36313.1 hypothetical protein DAMNIGENAA_37460 [Desulforhabdus amnigena]